MWYGISCSFLVIITHSCYHQKAHSIPYHTVNTWNSVVNPSELPIVVGELLDLTWNQITFAFSQDKSRIVRINQDSLNSALQLSYGCLKIYHLGCGLMIIGEHSCFINSVALLICPLWQACKKPLFHRDIEYSELHKMKIDKPVLQGIMIVK